MTPFVPPQSIARRLRQLTLLVLATALLWFLLESLLFRTGFYYRHLVEPYSNAGATSLSLRLARREASPNPPTVLVFGDSRVREGFSSVTAEAAEPDLNFINVGVPGSTPRTWYYLLRRMTQKQVPFDAIAIGILYQPVGSIRWDNRTLDPAFMAPLVGLRDAIEFPASFDDPEVRKRAHQTVWLPALLMQSDIRNLLTTEDALQKRSTSRQWWLNNIQQKKGREDAMPELAFTAQHQVIDWGDITAKQRSAVEQHLRTLAQTPAAENVSHAAYWIGKLHALAQENGAQLILYPLPRGPYPAVLSGNNELAAGLAELGAQPGVTILPADFLADLEAPEYFFDALHANQAGRETTSTRLAQAVADLIDIPAKNPEAHARP